ncbi:MAG: hypothetical protein N2327_01150 [Caldimicrobium sp.]|nr:hypothetical protein [Caldimicrobium sp.]MCX7873027.1 hypothetical protein [Caldimicrobium sp.]MDW8094842.1 hypothetical protein [Caldimicrobium sp.]
MKCPKCRYFFSEELRNCPRCGQDMGVEIEKLGLFPISTNMPFLDIEDFVEQEETFEAKRSLELSISDELT